MSKGTFLTFDRQTAKDIVGEDHEDFERIEEKLVDTTRWSVHYEAIFKQVSTGKLYRVGYSRGATECQDERPFDYENEVKFQEVKEVEKVIKSYEPV